MSDTIDYVNLTIYLMNIAEVVKLADELVFTKTGKHLDYLQEAILRGTLKEHTYHQIAEKVYTSPSHLRNVGSELWQILSEGLGQEITKANLKAILDEYKISNYQSAIVENITGDHVTVNNKLNICSKKARNPKKTKPSQENTNQQHIDLGDAPEIFSFYGRNQELATLEKWIIDDVSNQDNLVSSRTRFLTILGISGIGKTALAMRLIDKIKNQFNYIIYRSLRFSPTLENTLSNLLQIFSPSTENHLNNETPINQIINYLRNYRCLIVFDDMQVIFSSGKLTGQYKSGYEDYQKFFQTITETEHQSNVILISQEKCSEMCCLDEKKYPNYPIKSLELLGLFDVELLKNTGLQDEKSWLKLINLYEGNPAYLKSIVNLIKDIFDGNVAEFLAENNLVITKDMQYNFNQLFNRLSPIEQEFVLELGKFEQPLSREDLRQNLDWSSMDLVNVLQSLQQRYLVRKIKRDKILFQLSAVFQEYVINCCEN